MSIEHVTCTHCGHGHVIPHCEECGGAIPMGTPGVFINSVQFNASAQDLYRAAAEKTGKPNVAGRGAINLCMPCAAAGVNLPRLILADERQWPDRTV